MRRPMPALLRERLAEPGVLNAPGAFNTMSARIIEDAGSQVMALSTAAVSATLLGKPDLGLITLDEMVITARYITVAVNTPLLVDAGTGHGNAINAMRTTEEIIRAGAAGMYIVDHGGGHGGSGPPIPLAEAVGKFAACVHVRDQLDPDFLIIAATHADNIDDIAERSKAYAAVGADMICPNRVCSVGDALDVCQSIEGPVFLAQNDMASELSLARLADLGVGIVAVGDGPLRSAAGAMLDYLDGFKAEDVAYVLRFLDEVKQKSTGNMHAFVGFPAIRELEETYLPKEDVIARYENSIGYKP